MKKSAQLILMRHGQSDWNKRNLFTGWVDIPLSKEGVFEALETGKKIADMPIDVIFVSSLMRAQMTAMLVMSVHNSGRVPIMKDHLLPPNMQDWDAIHDEETKKLCIPVISAWEINERMYGKLQGLNKQATIDKFGADQVKIWRRSYDVAPPEGESLEMTAARSIPYFKKTVVPYLEQGKNVFICAHGNSLRSIVMHIENLTKEQVLNFEIATGEPIVYTYDQGNWQKK